MDETKMDETNMEQTNAETANLEEANVQETATGDDIAQETEQAAEQAPTEQADEQIAEQELTDVAVLQRGDIVKGKIVKVEDQQAIVDLGYKFDGVIPLRELSPLQIENASEAVSEGDEVELKVIRIDEEDEKLILSKRAVDAEKAWESLQQHFEAGTILEAVVADVVKGGLVVDVGVRGFIPASMVERHFVEDFSSYKGRTLRLKVKELDRDKNKVILSHKDVLEEEYEQQKQEILSKLTAGDIIDGKVQRLTPFGAFVDIGGIDGLVHISEMAWTRVEHPSDVVSEGQDVKVKVLKVDPENERISLSIKETLPGPWESIEGKVEPGDVITGTVKRLVSFGAFVEIAPGVEGLVHISQIAHRHIGTPHEELEEGQEVQVKVLDLNIEEKRASLSIKETLEEPDYQRDQRASYEKDSNTGFNLTLGERFGNKLDQFKK